MGSQTSSLPSDSDLYRLAWWRGVDLARAGKITWTQLRELSGRFVNTNIGPTGLLAEQLGRALDELLEANDREAMKAKEMKPADPPGHESEPSVAPATPTAENEAIDGSGPDVPQPTLNLS